MSLVEGSGNFECTAECHADRPFKTTNLKEYNEHLNTEGHILVNGIAECSNCGASYHYDSLAIGTKPVCEKCAAPEVGKYGGKKPKK